MTEAPHFEFDRCDKYMYFASNVLPSNPTDVGVFLGGRGKE
jgi:hypothetical protein